MVKALGTQAAAKTCIVKSMHVDIHERDDQDVLEHMWDMLGIFGDLFGICWEKCWKMMGLGLICLMLKDCVWEVVGKWWGNPEEICENQKNKY